MTTQEQYIERLKELVAVKYGRPITTVEECASLLDDVAEQTHVVLGVNALEQMFVVCDGKYMPRPHILSTLARYVGYGGWSDFCTSSDVVPAEDRDNIRMPQRWGVIILTAVAVVVVVVTAVLLLRGGEEAVEEPSAAIVAVEGVDSRFTYVKDEWVAGTTEHCLAVREWEDMDAEAYMAHVQSVNEQYKTLMNEAIRRDLVLYAAAHNITVDDATIESTAQAIAQICSSMCDCLTK